MQAYTVICRNPRGEEAWSLTQEAESPAWAVARTCLPRHQREAYVAKAVPWNGDTFPHPLSIGYTIEVIPCTTP